MGRSVVGTAKLDSKSFMEQSEYIHKADGQDLLAVREEREGSVERFLGVLF